MLKKNIETCPECGNDVLISDNIRGEIVCNVCGLVLSQRIVDSGPEWRAFTSEEARIKSRVGSPINLTLYDKGLSTTIDRKNKDAFGKSINPQTISNFHRLRKWHTRTRRIKSAEKNLAYAMSQLDRLASQLKMSKDSKILAAYILRKAVNKKLTAGRSIEALLLAAIYISWKSYNIPKTFDDFNDLLPIQKSKISRYSRLLSKELNIKIGVPSPKIYISRFSTELNLSGKVQNRAFELLKLAEKDGFLIGKSPIGIAGAAIYAATLLEGERRSQREISLAIKVTEPTLRKYYKKLIKLAKQA